MANPPFIGVERPILLPINSVYYTRPAFQLRSHVRRLRDKANHPQRETYTLLNSAVGRSWRRHTPCSVGGPKSRTKRGNSLTWYTSLPPKFLNIYTVTCYGSRKNLPKISEKPRRRNVHKQSTSQQRLNHITRPDIIKRRTTTGEKHHNVHSVTFFVVILLAPNNAISRSQQHEYSFRYWM